MPRPQFILFDAVGTVIHPCPAAVDVYLDHGRRHGIELPRDVVAARFKQAIVRQREWDRENEFRTSPDRERQRWQRIVAEVFAETTDTDRLLNSLWDHFAGADGWRLDPEFEPLIARLSTSAVRWGLASNFDERLHLVCARWPVFTQARELFVSSLLGHAKPGLEFFRAIETRLGLEPERLLLIGNDPVEDYDAARSAGWQAVLLGETQSADQNCIATLADLPAWLEATR